MSDDWNWIDWNCHYCDLWRQPGGIGAMNKHAASNEHKVGMLKFLRRRAAQAKTDIRKDEQAIKSV